MPVTTDTLPRLVDRKTIATELGITNSSAERIMRQIDKIKIGRRVFVLEDDVRDYLKSEAKR